MKKSELMKENAEFNEDATKWDTKEVLNYFYSVIGDTIKANMGQNGGEDSRSKQKQVVQNLRVAKKAIKAAMKGTKPEKLWYRNFMLPK